MDFSRKDLGKGEQGAVQYGMDFSRRASSYLVWV